MRKIKLNQDACIACGACVTIDPEHFDFDDSGLSHVISQDNTESANVINAIESCPTSAISKDNDQCDCGENCDCIDCHCQEN